MISNGRKFKTIAIGIERNQYGDGTLYIDHLESKDNPYQRTYRAGIQNPSTADIYEQISQHNTLGYYVSAVAGNAINASSTVIMTQEYEF
jgi:hypothetical protein